MPKSYRGCASPLEYYLQNPSLHGLSLTELNSRDSGLVKSLYRWKQVNEVSFPKAKPGRKGISKEEIKKIRKLYSNYGSSVEVSLRTGYAISTIQRYCKDILRENFKEIRPDKLKTLLNTFTKTGNISASAKKAGVSFGTAKKYIDRSGLRNKL